MIAEIQFGQKKHRVDLGSPIDLSLCLQGTPKNVTAWYQPPPTIEAVQYKGKRMLVKDDAPVNFRNITFNPHAHGTHTESLGHITPYDYPINNCLNNYMFWAELITVPPLKMGDDFVISKAQLSFALGQKKRDAVIIRTLPNTPEKKHYQYSNTNPPYLLEEAAGLLLKKNVKHLLVDLPSVDKEEDQGKLAAHRAFWDIKNKPRTEATITELIFVPNEIKDGMYLLNLQVASIENDASPSRPVIYKIVE